MKSRNAYFDYLRGIAILMIVAIHCYDAHSTDSVQHLLRNTFNCAVPLFFAISGFFLGRKDVKYTELVMTQVPKVYIPMLVWSLPFLVSNLIAGKAIHSSLLMFLIGGFGVFYFTAVIIQYYLLLPVMVKVVDRFKMGGVFLSFVVSGLSVATVTYHNIVSGMHLPLILYAGLFPLWSVFYITGIYLGRQSNRQYPVVLPLVLMMFGLFLSQIESEYLFSNYGSGVGIKPTSFIFSLAMLFLLFSVKTETMVKKFLGQENSFLCYLGSVSFGIYLIHLHVVKRFASHLTDSWLLKWAITVVVTVCLIQLLRKIMPEKWHRYFGI